VNGEQPPNPEAHPSRTKPMRHWNHEGGASALEPGGSRRRILLSWIASLIDRHSDRIYALPVTRAVAPEEIRGRLSRYDFDSSLDAESVLDDCADMLTSWTVHTPHPRYFGLFNPAPTFMGILADSLAASFNPQLAVWSHAPAANEIERHVLNFMGRRLGYDEERLAGSFTTGGAEANLTAVLLALTRTFPEYATGGVRALPGQPVFYASEQSHLAWLKIAHTAGLGRDAVRLVPTGSDLRMDLSALRALIGEDRRRGHVPFLVVATAGTTGTGVIDSLPQLVEICDNTGTRLHVDAAWGGAVALSDELRHVLDGIDKSDSVTVDAHKWLSVPMGAGMFLCTDQEGLYETFRVTTKFMPATTPDTTDPYVHSIQWSRRFIGLKLFMSLAVAGRSGYASQIEKDCALGDYLRSGLQKSGWQIVNETPLPVVCFVNDGALRKGADEFHDLVAAQVVERGRAWISTTRVAGRTALRACITSFRTDEGAIDVLVDELERARSAAPGA
jgi:aromatic-L-amino-acid/L-tryptophan decarboxylase